MVTTYWDMACSFVVNGAIDEKMFNDANGEHIATYAKLEPFVAQIREVMKMPRYMENLEKVVMNLPDAATRLTRVREMLKQAQAKRANFNPASKAEAEKKTPEPLAENKSA
jgi:hypothetical protein